MIKNNLEFVLLLVVFICFKIEVKAELIHEWTFNSDNFKNNIVLDQKQNLDGELIGDLKIYEDAKKEFIELDGEEDHINLGDDISKIDLPEKSISIETVVRFRERGRWRGTIGAFQDNGDYERGWVLGLEKHSIFFDLASDKDKGLRTVSSREIELGKWYHVVATYDGETQKLYLNGELVSQFSRHSGDIIYPPKGWLTIGSYKDDNENYPMKGSIRQIKLYDNALTREEITAGYNSNKDLTDLPVDLYAPSDFLVHPYLQFATKNSIVIRWETKTKSTSKILYGEETPLEKSVESKKFKTLHEVKLNNLKPQTNYFYKAISVNKKGEKSESKIFGFQTGVEEDDAFAFGVISDTQDNPDIWKKIAELLFGERPNFAILAGDIVGDGDRKIEWTDEFLKTGQFMMSYIPVYAVLGNHDVDSKYYYDYLTAPDPEYYYTFKYGNAQFFLIDSNRDVDKGSEQYKWLEEELKKSSAQWKFTVHHHPPYSSDEDDYGDAWKGKSERGDKDLLPIVDLYEKYDVDICFYGHIHDYERTWPLRDNKVDRDNGVIYIQTGGAGGSLENYAPTRSWFTRKVHRDHNYLIVNIHENELHLQAIDWNGNLFDTLKVIK
jgi:predicted phosphodiesterase